MDVMLSGDRILRKSGSGWTVGVGVPRTIGECETVEIQAPHHYASPGPAIWEWFAEARSTDLGRALDRWSTHKTAILLFFPGVRLQIMRDRAGLTRKEVAKRAGISARQLLRIETDDRVQPKAVTVARIIQACLEGR
jgi:DNA-binding XRE family transcriptional regulator